MQAIDLYEALCDGAYRGTFTKVYGETDADNEIERMIHLVNSFMAAYGEECEVRIFSVPYSVLLAGDGADISLATDRDFLCAAAVTEGRNIKFSAVDYIGTDDVDTDVMGPFRDETGYTVSVIRGISAAFGRRGFRIGGADIYADCDTLPGAGLEEVSHMAISVAYVLNMLFNDGRLSEKQISECVQWTLANYVGVDSYATDTYSSIQGDVLSGNFRKADSPIIRELKPDMCGCGLYIVNVGETEVNLPEEEADARLDDFINELGKEPDELSEGEFYARLKGMQASADCEARLFLMDYYTQENLEKIYNSNAVRGTGSPSLSQTVSADKKSCGAKDACEPFSADWKILCCVGDENRDTFVTAMNGLFGDGCVEPVGFSLHPACEIVF